MYFISFKSVFADNTFKIKPIRMKFYILDVFGTEKYSGNQLATFLEFGTLSTETMQKIAQEINFSETTFITAKETDDKGFAVRIFTPKSEIEFAGHPSLGTAHIIRKYLAKGNTDQINLSYKVGQISVEVNHEIYWMTHNPPQFGRELGLSTISHMLGLKPSEIDDRYPILEVSTGLPFVIVPLKEKLSLKSAKIDMSSYEIFIKEAWAKEILVFCPDTYEIHHDLASRVFVDYLGIPEDPATGSATGCLSAYLLKVNYFKKNKIMLTVGQGYEIFRPSELKISAKRDQDVYDIRVGGKVMEIAEGEWKI